VACPGRHEPPCAKLLGERVANPLEALSVGARGDQRGGSGVPQHIQPQLRIARKPAAVRAMHAARHVLGQRSFTHHGGAGESQKLAQHRGLGIEAMNQHGITQPLQASDLGVFGE